MALFRSPLALLVLLVIFHAWPSILSSATSLPTQVRVTNPTDFVGIFDLDTQIGAGDCPQSIEHESGLRRGLIPHSSIKHDNEKCRSASSLAQISASALANLNGVQNLLNNAVGPSASTVNTLLESGNAILAAEAFPRSCPSVSLPAATIVLLINFDTQALVDEFFIDGLGVGDRIMHVYYLSRSRGVVTCQYLLRRDDPTCFPAAARVTLRDGSAKPISTLRLGDAVQVGPDEHSEVFFFTHRQSDGLHDFVRLSTAAGALTVSPGHYIYLNGRLTAASAARVGDALTRADGSPDRILRVETVRAPGLYNPQTLHGDIVVDGFRASTYTTAVQPALADTLLAPLRGLHRLGAKLDPISRWFDAGAGRLAKWVPKGLIQY